MPRIVDVKCPRCGAPLPIQPGVDVVTCQYCGTRSVVDRGRGPMRVPQTAAGMHVVRVAPSSAAPVIIVALAGLLVVAGIGVAVALSVTASSKSPRPTSPGRTPPTPATAVAAAPRSYFSDQPMIAEVNG